MRKLAREAVIFALLGQLLSTVGFFVRLDSQNRTEARAKAEAAVHAGFDLCAGLEPKRPCPVFLLVQVPLSNGTVLQVRQCAKDLTPGVILPPGTWTPVDQDCRTLFSEKEKDQLSLGDADQVAIERDYWAAYHETRNLGSSAPAGLFLGLWGFPAGIGLWGFYRLVRFAVKG